MKNTSKYITTIILSMIFAALFAFSTVHADDLWESENASVDSVSILTDEGTSSAEDDALVLSAYQMGDADGGAVSLNTENGSNGTAADVRSENDGEPETTAKETELTDNADPKASDHEILEGADNLGESGTAEDLDGLNPGDFGNVTPLPTWCEHKRLYLVIGMDSTCLLNGIQTHWLCRECHAKFLDRGCTVEVGYNDLIIETEGHNIVTDPAVDPTYIHTGLSEGSHCDKCGEVFVKQQEIPVKTINGPDGLLNEAADDGNLYYIINNKVATDVTTVAANSSGSWYVQNGVVDTTINDIVTCGTDRWFIENGKVDENINGFYDEDPDKWYVQNGRIDTTRTDAVFGTNDGETAWWYIENGKINYEKENLVVEKNGIWFIKDGKVDESVNLITSKEEGSWVITNGFGDRGLSEEFVKYDDSYYYVVQGAVNTKLNGFARGMIEGELGSYYCVEGVCDTERSGIVADACGLWLIENGRLLVVNIDNYEGKYKIVDGKATRILSSNNMVFFGDSVAWGYQLNYDEKFATLTSDMLKMNNYNYAVPGEGFLYRNGVRIESQVQDAAREMSQDERNNTKVVVIEGGWNDINNYFKFDSTPILENTLSAIQTMIDRCKSIFTNATICLLYGEKGSAAFPDERETIYSNWINGVNSYFTQKYKNDSSVIVASGFDKVLCQSGSSSPDPSYYLDIIHPNAQGHKVISEWLTSQLLK